MGTSSDEIGRLDRRAVMGTAVACAAIAGIGWVDFTTGPKLGFSVFYLVPVVAAGFWLGRVVAVACAVLASAAWFAADFTLVGPAESWISVWNGVSRLLIFTFVGLITALLTRDRQRLRVLLVQSEQQARTDALTGLPNLRAFLELLEAELARARRERRSICAAYVDLDGFKHVNDVLGHARGNELLEQVGQTIRGAMRAGDTVARIGGDEFAILFWNADASTGREIAKRLVDRVVAMRQDFPGTKLGASAGVAFFEECPGSSDEVVRAADAAMYEAKAAGKARVVVHQIRAGGQSSDG